jgi:hypothetical protein
VYDDGRRNVRGIEGAVESEFGRWRRGAAAVFARSQKPTSYRTYTSSREGAASQVDRSYVRLSGPPEIGCSGNDTWWRRAAEANRTVWIPTWLPKDGLLVPQAAADPYGCVPHSTASAPAPEHVTVTKVTPSFRCAGIRARYKLRGCMCPQFWLGKWVLLDVHCIMGKLSEGISTLGVDNNVTLPAAWRKQALDRASKTRCSSRIEQSFDHCRDAQLQHCEAS